MNAVLQIANGPGVEAGAARRINKSIALTVVKDSKPTTKCKPSNKEPEQLTLWRKIISRREEMLASIKFLEQSIERRRERAAQDPSWPIDELAVKGSSLGIEMVRERLAALDVLIIKGSSEDPKGRGLRMSQLRRLANGTTKGLTSLVEGYLREKGPTQRIALKSWVEDALAVHGGGGPVDVDVALRTARKQRYEEDDTGDLGVIAGRIVDLADDPEIIAAGYERVAAMLRREIEVGKKLLKKP